MQLKKKVGGVELGRQFIEVQVDQPIEECERLVRERENCMTIGDAFTSGLTIAWPSACVCQYLTSWVLLNYICIILNVVVTVFPQIDRFNGWVDSDASAHEESRCKYDIFMQERSEGHILVNMKRGVTWVQW